MKHQKPEQYSIQSLTVVNRLDDLKVQNGKKGREEELNQEKVLIRCHKALEVMAELFAVARITNQVFPRQVGNGK